MRVQKEYNTPFYYLGLAGISVFLLAVLVLHCFDLTFFDIVPPCQFYTATGYQCPGCGGTRAVMAMLEGKFLLSLSYHPMVLFVVVFYGWFLISQTIERITRHKIAIGLNYRNIYVFSVLFLIGINWIVKNVIIFLH